MGADDVDSGLDYFNFVFDTQLCTNRVLHQPIDSKLVLVLLSFD